MPEEGSAWTREWGRGCARKIRGHWPSRAAGGKVGGLKTGRRGLTWRSRFGHTSAQRVLDVSRCVFSVLFWFDLREDRLTDAAVCAGTTAKQRTLRQEEEEEEC